MTLAKIFASANHGCWFCINRMVSRPKAEKVVNAPKKPGIKNSETFAGKVRAAKRPMAKHPRALTTKVAQGNTVMGKSIPTV